MSVMTIIVWVLIVVAALISLLNALAFGKKALGTTIVAAGIATSLAVFYFARGFVTTIALIAGLILIACMVWLIQRNSVSRQKTVAYVSALVACAGLCAGGASLYANPQQVETINMVAVQEGDQVKKYKITDHAPQEATASVTEEIKATWPKPEPMVHFANQAEPGTNNFGPRQTFETVRDAQFRFGEKLVKDPTFLAAIEETHHNQRNASQKAIEDRAQALTNREAQHAAAFAELDKIESFALADYGDVGYESLGMIPSKDDKLPKITAFSTQQKMQLVLVVQYKDGKFLMLRVDCDLQPSFFKKFTEIPRYAHKEKAPTQAPQVYTAPKPIGNGNPKPTPKTSTPPSGGGNPPPSTTNPPTTQPPAPGTSTPPAPSTPPSSTTPPATTTPSQPPATTTPPTQPPATTKTTPPSTTETTPPSTTETTPPAPSTPPSTPPTGDGKKPDAGPDPAPGHEEPAPEPAPEQGEEVAPPPPADPVDPVIPPAAPAPDIVAPEAVPPVPLPNPGDAAPALPAPPPPVVDVAPAPSNPGQGFVDPDVAPAPAPAPLPEPAPAPAPIEQAPIQQPAPIEPAPVTPGNDIVQQQVEIPAQEPIVDFGQEPVTDFGQEPVADTGFNQAPSADTAEESFVDGGDIAPVAFTYERNNWLDAAIVLLVLATLGCVVQSLRHRA